MLTATEKATLRKKLAEYEGSIPHMYLDTKGYVTVGVGHLLTSAAAAQKLDFRKGGKKATAAEIKTDYDTVEKQTKGKLASFYKKHTELVLAQTTIDSLTDKHIQSFEKELKRIYADFDKYPSEVRLALFDMIFNLGMTKLKNVFVNFTAAIKAKNWKKAATASKRAGIQPARNNYVKGLLEKAAKNAATKLDGKIDGSKF